MRTITLRWKNGPNDHEGDTRRLLEIDYREVKTECSLRNNLSSERVREWEPTSVSQFIQLLRLSDNVAGTKGEFGRLSGESQPMSVTSRPTESFLRLMIRGFTFTKAGSRRPFLPLRRHGTRCKSSISMWISIHRQTMPSSIYETRLSPAHTFTSTNCQSVARVARF
jgi:hypothetical protein